MQRRIKLSASIICADLLNLERDIRILQQKGIDFLHFDMMDGHFVPRIGLGTFFLKQLSSSQSLPVEAHLMVSAPGKYVDELADAGAAMITGHHESAPDIPTVLDRIKQREVKTGVALHPETPISVVEPYVDLLDLILLMAYAPGANPSPHRRLDTLRGVVEGHDILHRSVGLNRVSRTDNKAAVSAKNIDEPARFRAYFLR